MKSTLIYTDEKSNKFWTIETNANEFTVTYGKVGTDGQTSSKSFDSEEKCNKEAEKLIAEKTKKGYVEQGEGSTTSVANENFKYYDASPFDPEHKSDVDAVYEVVAEALENLEAEEKQLTGLLVWFDPENGGLQGWGVKMSEDNQNQKHKDELDYDDDDFFFEEYFMLESVVDNYDVEDEDDDRSEYETLSESGFSIIGYALMQLHQDGKLKNIAGSYPFPVYVHIEDEGENKIFTVFNENGIAPANNEALNAYNKAAGVFDKPTVTQKVKAILGEDKKKETKPATKTSNISLEKPLSEEQKKLTEDEKDDYEFLQYALKLLAKNKPDGNDCRFEYDTQFGHLNLFSGDYQIYSGDANFERRGMWFEGSKDVKQADGLFRKLIPILLEDGSFDKIVSHPFEITLLIEGLPKQTLFTSKQDGKKIIFTEAQQQTQKSDNEKTAVERFVDTAYTETMGKRDSEFEQTRIGFLNGEIPFDKLKPFLKQTDLSNHKLGKKAPALFNLVMDNKDEMYPIFKRFIEMTDYICSEDVIQFMDAFLDKDAHYCTYGAFTDAMHDKRPAPEVFLKESKISPAYWIEILCKSDFFKLKDNFRGEKPQLPIEQFRILHQAFPNALSEFIHGDILKSYSTIIIDEWKRKLIVATALYVFEPSEKTLKVINDNAVYTVSYCTTYHKGDGKYEDSFAYAFEQVLQQKNYADAMTKANIADKVKSKINKGWSRGFQFELDSLIYALALCEFKIPSLYLIYSSIAKSTETVKLNDFGRHVDVYKKLLKGLYEFQMEGSVKEDWIQPAENRLNSIKKMLDMSDASNLESGLAEFQGEGKGLNQAKNEKEAKLKARDTANEAMLKAKCEAMNTTADKAAAYAGYFSFLNDTPGIEDKVTKALYDIMTIVINTKYDYSPHNEYTEYDRGSLTFELDNKKLAATYPELLQSDEKNGYLWVSEKWYDKKQPEEGTKKTAPKPEYFQKQLDKCNDIRLSGIYLDILRSVFIEFSDHQFVNREWGLVIKPKDWKTMGFKGAGVVPIRDMNGIWIFHHTEKNSHGEPKLCRANYDYTIEEFTDYNAGALFVKLLAEMVGIKTDW